MTGASYLAVRPLSDGETVHISHSIGGHLLVDVDEHGWVIGIESVAGMVTKGDLRKVIECMRWPS